MKEIKEEEKDLEISNDTNEKNENTVETIENMEEKNEEIREEKDDEKAEETQTILEEVTIPEQEENSQEMKKKDVLHWYIIVVAIVSILLLIGLGIFSTVFGLANRSNDKIVKGVWIQGIDVSNLTKEEAIGKLNEIFTAKLKENITLKHKDFETSILPEQIEMSFNMQEAVDMAYSVGRSGKLLKDNYAIVNASFNKMEVKPAYQYNDKALTDYLMSVQENLPDNVKQSGYSIDGNNLVISKGQNGVLIKQEQLKKQIIEACTNINDHSVILEMPVEDTQPERIDLQKIHSEIYKEAQDAYYTKDPFTIYPHVNGMDFKVSIEEAQKLLNGDQDEIIIPLKITVPSKRTNQIGTEAFPDLLATYSTTFSTKNTNRTTNIKLSSNKINGVVLMPGQQFSYNTVVGKRTAAGGYKTAPVYVGGRVEEGIGGGICQVSSTLYNTALRANLQIVKRSNHRFATGYVPLSTDATVSWGGPEFIFKNSRKYPIKIVTTVNGGKITISIYGCREEIEYDVEIKSETLQTIPMKTVYRNNTSLAKGTKKTVQKGHGGYKSRAYRILKLDGKVISKQLLSTDTYAQLETIIEQNP